LRESEGNPNIVAIHRFFAPVMRDGVMQLVKTTAKETSREDQNNPLYTLEAVEAIEVGEVSPVPEMVDADRTEGSRLLTGLTGLVDSVAQRVKDFNPATVSKVVDENGEPLVVYYGPATRRKLIYAGRHKVNETLDSEGCAKLLYCTTELVEEMARLGELPATKIGRSWLFIRADLLTFLADKARDEAQERRAKRQPGVRLMMPKSRRQVPPVLPSL
jgi:excisionase family DNA binding protein